MVLRGVRAYGPALISRWAVPPHRFAILTTGRTGSELLVSLLDSHPRIACAGELLHEGRAFPNQYVAARAAMARLRGMEAYGWKLLLSQYRNPGGIVGGIGDPDKYPARLNRLGYRLILLERQNPVQQAMSFIRAAETQFHHHRGDRAEFAPTAVDAVTLMAATWIIEADTAALGRSLDSEPHLRLTYEDDLLDPGRHQATVDRVCDYLGIDSAPVRSDLVKIAPRRIRAMVSNYDEVSELFRGTRYASYLGDDEKAALGTASRLRRESVSL